MKQALAILLLLISGVVKAQEKFDIKGIIFDGKTKQRVENASIVNKATQKTILSDSWGTFSIPASVNDTIVMSKNGYNETQYIIVQKQNLVIYLQPNIVLDEVTIKGKTKQLEQREILEGYKSKGVYYNGYPPLLAYVFTPLTALHELLGKDAKNARNFASYAARENTELTIDKVFNKAIITKHTTIQDSDIAEFMFYYRPKPDDIAHWNEYDKIKYIQDSFKDFQKRKKDIN